MNSVSSLTQEHVAVAVVVLAGLIAQTPASCM